jgi:hypothetical protein
MNTRVFDIEIFPNYMLVCFYNPATATFDDFEFCGREKKQDTGKLQAYIKTIDVCIGFNNLQFDNHVLKALLMGKDVKAAKAKSDDIIAGKAGRKNERLAPKDLDVLGILDRKGSLKIFECRLGLPRVLESPIGFDSEITPRTANAIKDYCHADILATWALWSNKTTQDKAKVKAQASEVYGQPLTSATESEIASMVLQAEIKKILGLDTFSRMDKFRKPCEIFSGSEIINQAICFEKPELQKLLAEAVAFRFGQDYFKASFAMAGLTINIGQGGMHSVGKTAIITSLSDGQAIIDHDVSSYYPNIIMAEGIAPEGLENAFLTVYQSILASRLSAKKAGDKATANCYKIILNSTYGKFGDKSSWIYNPKNETRVTLNCQFRLLQLIEKIALAQIEILQINTDGVLCFCKTVQEQSRLKQIVTDWQAMTGLEMEEARYSKLIMKDVNNYVAQYDKGSGCKEKGIFQSELNLFGGGAIPLVLARAARHFFFDGQEPEKTIAGAENLLDFCLFAKRERWLAGGITSLQPKVNRWVWGKGVNNVLKSATEQTERTDDYNVILANDLASISKEQLDLARYIQAAKNLIESIKTGKTPKAIEKEKAKGASPQNLTFFDEPEEPEQPHTGVLSR